MGNWFQLCWSFWNSGWEEMFKGWNKSSGCRFLSRASTVISQERGSRFQPEKAWGSSEHGVFDVLMRKHSHHSWELPVLALYVCSSEPWGFNFSIFWYCIVLVHFNCKCYIPCSQKCSLPVLVWWSWMIYKEIWGQYNTMCSIQLILFHKLLSPVVFTRTRAITLVQMWRL